MELIEAVKNILREYDNMVELESPVRKILLEKVSYILDGVMWRRGFDESEKLGNVIR